MWETTGDASALSDFETRAAKFNTGTTTYVDSDFDWSNVKNLGMYIYLLSKRSGRTAATVTAIQKAATTAADALVTNRNNSGYGRALSGKAGAYYWGSNGAVARTCMLLQVANRLAPKADYLDTCVDQISWIFGRNYYNRSQVTGLGINPPMHPHHRPSQADGIDSPWPGLLVGGGNNTSTQAAGNKNGATNWIDDVNDYELNEVAINWNAPLTYALAGFLDPFTGLAGSDAAVPQSDANNMGGAGGGVAFGRFEWFAWHGRWWRGWHRQWRSQRWRWWQCERRCIRLGWREFGWISRKRREPRQRWSDEHQYFVGQWLQRLRLHPRCVDPVRLVVLYPRPPLRGRRRPLALNDALAAPMAEVFDPSLSPTAVVYAAKVPEILRSTSLPVPAATASKTLAHPVSIAMVGKRRRHDAAYWQRVMLGQNFDREGAFDTPRFARTLRRSIMGNRPYPSERGSN